MTEIEPANMHKEECRCTLCHIRANIDENYDKYRKMGDV